jgi:glycosyltransferase involved in cell wall biosynthesis
MKELQERGYEIYLLTTCERGLLHEDLEQMDVRVYAHPLPKTNALIYYWKQLRFLAKFCKEHRIDIVLSHLQQVNIIAVFATYFGKARIVIYRHHFKYHRLSNDPKLSETLNKNEERFDRIINRFARKIIVPAVSVRDGMIRYEGADPDKISIMQYLYDFGKYKTPDAQEVERIKEKHKARLLLLMCSRLIAFKRHYIVFPVIKKLVQEKGMDLKLIVLDEGPEEAALKRYIEENKLGDHIFMEGYRTNFIDYMAAADLMLHPSLTEASNSAVKEMALLGKTSIVCDGVGDFSDYFVNGKNGYLIPAVDSDQHIEKILTDLYGNKCALQELGDDLRSTVLSRFSISPENVEKYIACFR